MLTGRAMHTKRGNLAQFSLIPKKGPARKGHTFPVRSELEAKMRSLLETIDLLGKQKDVFITQQQFLQAAEINKTISETQTERAQLKEQLQQLVNSAKESARHKKRRKEGKPTMTLTMTISGLVKGAIF